MKKNKIVIISLIVLLFLCGCKEKNEQNIVTTSSVSEMSYAENITNNPKTKTKQTITTFSTKIYDKNENRMNNLKVASKKLSNTIIKSGETFSFNNKMGPSNKKNGYEKAKIFDSKGNVLNEYGGRNMSNQYNTV